MAQKRKILFVDDEPRILSGLRRTFHNKNNEWEMFFADSAKTALAILENENMDVIISDMRMPEINGAELLKEVQLRYPNVIRIILSGQTELESVMRTVSVSHQFLTKPCDPTYLEEVIERSCSLQANLNSEYIKMIIGRIEKLPTLPKTYQILTEALSDPKVEIEKVASIFEQDISMTAKLLQLVNSAFFGLPQKTTSISKAITYIGLDVLKNLTLSMVVFDLFKTNNIARQQYVENLHKHSFECANIAKNLLEDKQKSNDAFLAGMLHEIGGIIIMFYFPKEYQAITNIMLENNSERHLVEKEVLGVTHAEIGGYLLGLWGIPYPIVEAVTFHLNPSSVKPKEFDILSAVYVADCLSDINKGVEKIDLSYLESLEVNSLLPKWKKMADSILTATPRSLL